MTNERIKETMAALFTMEQAKKEATAETPAEKPKRRRRSIIDKDLLPEPEEIKRLNELKKLNELKEENQKKKRKPRKKKDPALKKTYSMTILMTENMHQRFKHIAEKQELSMNGIVTRLIRKYIITHDIDLDDLDTDI